MTPLPKKNSDRFRHLLAPLLTLLTAALCSAQTTAPVGEVKKDDVIVLTPFTVDATKDTGYYSENTLAGSRMRTNLADLGASISVVTKQMMQDFASVDVNDVFRYEVNSEGSSTYTPQVQAFRGDGLLDANGGGVQDNTGATFTNATANRVRGLGVPSSATNYYPSISAIAPDAYNTQSFEISRGPNSMLFGLGSPAGIVNQTTTQATLNRNTARIEFRTDDRGTFRSNLSFNRSLVEDKLAVFGSFLYDDHRFERKPSYDITRRQYGALTYKPFSKTTIRANFENYDNRNRRPNTISPVDYVTQWNLAGRPTYDALTKKITMLSTGQVLGPYISSASSPYAQQVRDYIKSRPDYNPALRGTSATAFNGSDTNFSFYNGITIFGQTALNPVASVASPNLAASALYVPGLSEVNQGRAFMQIGNGQLRNWVQPLYTQTYRTTFGTPTNPAAAAPAFPTTPAELAAIWASPASSDVFNRDYMQSTGWTNNPFITNVGNYHYAAVTDRSIYDWKKVNIQQMNFGTQKNKNYNVELEQEITKDLFLSAGWFRQDFDQRTNYTVSQTNATALRVDVNKYLPNGVANPYFGLPFVNDLDPDRFVNTEVDDHFRAMLAYTPDFRQSNSWLKWLGHHQLLGLWSRDEYMSFSARQRMAYVATGSPSAAYRYLNNPNNNADGTRSGWSFGGATQRLFYLANPGDPYGKVTQSSGEWNPLTYTGNIQVYNYAANSFENANVTETFNTFDSPSRAQRTLQSLSAGMTNYLWNDRLVTTFGARLDKNKVRGTTTGIITLEDGTKIPGMTPQEKFLPSGYFNTDGILNRFNPWNRLTFRTKTGGGVLRPFHGWDAIDRRADGSQFWQFIRDFGVSYNWSDNNDVPAGAQVDGLGRQLPKPGGVGRDYGFQFALLDNKLFARVTWFESTNHDQRIGTPVALGRLKDTIDVILFRGWARTIALINMGQDPRSSSFDGIVAGSTEDIPVQAATEKIWQQAYNYYTDLPGAVTGTQDAVSKGLEFQLNYNTGNWRNRVTFGKQETKNSNVLKQFDDLFALRNPVWQSAKAADFLLPQYQSLATYTTTGTTPVDITNFWTSYGFNSAVRLNDQFGNTNVANYYAINVTSQLALAKDLDGQAAPNQRKYHWAYNTGYDFTSSRLRGFGIGGAERWESKSIIGYYGKVSGGNANPNLLDVSDITRPIYDEANFYTDLFVKYSRKIAGGRVLFAVQLNVENVFEDGHLQVVAVNYDGSPWGYRIIDSRKFTLTTSFDF